MTYKVGGDVDFRCTKCKMELAHTILAMVKDAPAKVRCNTCRTDRKYRATGKSDRASTGTRSAGTGVKKAKAVSKPSGLDNQEKWLAAMSKADADGSEFTDYNMRGSFKKGECILHSKFGRGFILGTIGNKIRVCFRDAEKFLIHGR